MKRRWKHGSRLFLVLAAIGLIGGPLVGPPVANSGARAADDAPGKSTERAQAKDDAQPAAKENAKDDDGKPSVWMKRKLDYTQHILAGIASGDFDQVLKNANAMKGLGKIEAFVRGRTPGYKAQLQVFQEANDEIIRQAQKENVDGATLAFTQLTISCINCHKQLREKTP